MKTDLRFNHVDIKKLSVCFTWDDNFFAHYRLIAPEFARRGMRCTFYINPGEEGFEDKYLPLYRELSAAGFEVGSHGYRHDNYSKVPLGVFESEITKAASAINRFLDVYPSTFAFPYHDFNHETLKTAKKFHLETRNTLGSSRQFCIKADSTLGEMVAFADDCALDGLSMVFSGHSAIPADGNCVDREGLGYGPIPMGVLCALLEHITTLAGTEVLTFEQAALKRYIMDNCDISCGSYTLTQKQLDWLQTFHIDTERLGRLI